jgi:hypothetical protein
MGALENLDTVLAEGAVSTSLASSVVRRVTHDAV